MLENETASPNSAEKEERALPDWAIAVIVIGLGSVAFVIIFGITVVRYLISQCTYFLLKIEWSYLEPLVTREFSPLGLNERSLGRDCSS